MEYINYIKLDKSQIVKLLVRQSGIHLYKNLNIIYYYSVGLFNSSTTSSGSIPCT